MTCGIYRIRNVVSGKVYVGQSFNIERRWNIHLCKLRGGYHGNPHLQSSWSKHGEDVFVFEVVLVCSVNQLTVEEQRALDRVPKELRYNYGSCADSPNRGRKLPSVSTAKRGRVVAPETKTKISASLTGRKRKREAVARSAQTLRQTLASLSKDEKRQRGIGCPSSRFRAVIGTDPEGNDHFFARIIDTEELGFVRSSVSHALRRKSRLHGWAWRYADIG